MRRRDLLRSGLASGAGVAWAFQEERSKLRIREIRLVRIEAKRPAPKYTPSAGYWGGPGTVVAKPLSMYSEYRQDPLRFQADSLRLGSFCVEISTDRGVKGYGQGGPGGGNVVIGHFAKLLIGEDPFAVERIWDLMWRASLHYGRAGVAIHAMSGIDLALWDLIGNALGTPVYKLLGGPVRERVPLYCTGNDIEQHVEFGFRKLKLAIPYGPADGRAGMQKNRELVQRARAALGADAEIMLDCWMAWTEAYTLEMAEMLAPLRVYWMEECLQPQEYAGFARLKKEIKTTRIATGEHEYTRFGFQHLLAHDSAAIWQPDIHWCGGLSELRKIDALASANAIPLIPHAGADPDAIHFAMASMNVPWGETFMPAPGGPPEVYRRFEEEKRLSRGPEGIYAQCSDRPGFGWDWNAIPL